MSNYVFLAHCSRFSSNGSGKASKQSTSPWREKTPSFGNNSPVKKVAKKTNSLNEMPHEKSEALQKQKSEPISQGRVRI